MDCPTCGERIHREELVDGDCPLCGASVEEGDDLALGEIADIFEPQTDAVTVNVDDEPAARSEMVLHVSPSTLDRLKPKRCSACSRWHVRFGDKEYRIQMRGDEGVVDVAYLCSLCATHRSDVF